MRWDAEKYQEAINKIHNFKFTVIGEFVNITTKVMHRCNDCKLEFTTIPANIINIKQGRGCRECFQKNRTKTHEQFLLDLEKVHGDKYTILGQYVQNKQDLEVLCNTCNNN